MELKLFFKNRIGAFFSIDALIALIVIFFVIMAVRPLNNYLPPGSNVHKDVLQSLSELKVGEVDNAYVQSLVANGTIKNLNNTILEQIGEFYVFDYPDVSRARNFASAVLSELNTTENFGIWFESGSSETLIFSKNTTSIESSGNVLVAREIISGIQAGNETKGYSARAFLSSDLVTNYYYFGGYVGDGNLSFNINYNGNISDEGEIEVAINKDFDFYINGIYYSHFVKNTTTPYEPDRYTFNTTLFSSGTNFVELRGSSLYAAGGFIKINYRGEASVLGQNKTYYFPGVDGLINVYDGFFIPSNLTSMEISLHMNSNYSTFLNIGNVTVYRGSTSGTQNISINNTYLSSILNYNSLNGKTIPLRLGLDNASYVGISQAIDVFSVTDISGSMNDNCGSCNDLTCSGASCTDADGCGTCDAKSADDILVDIILNNSGNRVGLTAYESTAPDANYHSLSNNSASLSAEISQWAGNGNTCICCGMNKAIRGFFPDGFRDQLVAYYTFNSAVSGTLADISGQSHNGTVTGAPTSVAGINGNAFRFAASGTNYISVPDILNMTKGSISFWFDPSRDDSNTVLDASSSSRYFFVHIDGSENLRFWFEDYNNIGYTGASQSVRNIHTSGWHHVAIVWQFNGASLSTQLYLNGVLIDSDSNPAGSVPNFNAPRIGDSQASGGSSWDFEGDIDEFRIYSKALNASEVLGLNDTTPVCGNGLTEVSEVCDGNRQWCQSGGSYGMQSCNSTCSGFGSCNLTGSCGDNVINAARGESCDDGNVISNDGCSSNCTLEDRYRSMVVMSDGLANRECSEEGTGSDTQDAIQAAADACQEHGIVTHAVGFGSSADETTLIAVAANGCNGSYYYSDATSLADVYRQIANSIQTDYAEQTLSTEGGVIHTQLYPDSYIRFNYNDVTIPYGLVITGESDFDDAKGGSFYVPAGATPVITRVVSYSGAKWTTGATINGNSIFNLTQYGNDFISLGDPYQITDANSVVAAGIQNVANVTIGSSSSNQTVNSSRFNKIIYTLSMNASSYSDILPIADGCVWNVELEDGSNLSNVRIPATYAGSDACAFNNSTFNSMIGSNDYGVIVNANDAYQVATLDLLRAIDLNDNGKIDIPFTNQDLQITLSEIEGIPFTFYSEVQVRRWI